MRPKSHQAIVVAAIVVAAAAALGIAAIEGWLPLGRSPATPTSVVLDPADSLSPGESIVTPTQAPAPAATSVAPEPAPIPPAAPPEPAAKPAAKAPAYARAPAEATERRDARKPCTNCGSVFATTFRQADLQRGGAWEVRVRFDDGTRATLRFPTDPGFRVGERVIFANGRLQHH